MTITFTSIHSYSKDEFETAYAQMFGVDDVEPEPETVRRPRPTPPKGMAWSELIAELDN